MPILAVCPYCGEGKVRAPDAAVGLSATCPRCYSAFTIMASEKLAKAPAKAAAPKPKPVPRPVPAAPSPKPSPPEIDDEPTEALDETPAPAPAAEPTWVAPFRLAEPEEEDEPRWGPGVPFALVALIVGSLSLLATYAPFGRVIATVGSAAGLLCALFSLVLTKRKWLLPSGAALANAAVLVLVVALPTWLGLSGWVPAEVPVDTNVVKSFGHDGNLPQPADWVDAATASWQINDVRVGLVSAGVGPAELVGPGNRHKWSKTKYLQVALRVTNVGVAREFDFQGWDQAPPPPPAPDAPAPPPPPRLTDAAGKELKAGTFESGWGPVAKAQTKHLFPGKWADQVLYFEPPAGAVDHLRLELPGAVFASPEAVVRLQLSRASLYGGASPVRPAG
jgi:hypothetical protein